MILVVDDNKILSELVCRQMKDAGYSVEIAHDGECAHAILQKRYDCKCVILDMHMPKINGAELLMLMAADGCDVPVIVMAAFEDFEQDQFRGFPNVKEFFPKPFEPEALLEKVQKLAPLHTGN